MSALITGGQERSKLNLEGVNLQSHDEQCKTLTMLQLNVLHVDTRKILIFNNLYIIRDSFERNDGKMC